MLPIGSPFTKQRTKGRDKRSKQMTSSEGYGPILHLALYAR